jgi:hypothetical protein
MIPLPGEIEKALSVGQLPEAPMTMAQQVLETEPLLALLRRNLRDLFRRQLRSAET